MNIAEAREAFNQQNYVRAGSLLVGTVVDAADIGLLLSDLTVLSQALINDSLEYEAAMGFVRASRLSESIRESEHRQELGLPPRSMVRSREHLHRPSHRPMR